MVDPASPHWIGIDLPADMILSGCLVLEDFIPVKEHIERFYDPTSLQPREGYE
jgi:hypothetical protein